MKKTAILCPATISIGLISSKWKAHLLYHLSCHSEGIRFGELTRLVPEISRRVLSQSLDEMEMDGLVNREEFPEIPPKVVYTLSQLGQEMNPIINMLASFGYKYMKANEARLAEDFGSERISTELAIADKNGWT